MVILIHLVHKKHVASLFFSLLAALKKLHMDDLFEIADRKADPQPYKPSSPTASPLITIKQEPDTDHIEEINSQSVKSLSNGGQQKETIIPKQKEMINALETNNDKVTQPLQDNDKADKVQTLEKDNVEQSADSHNAVDKPVDYTVELNINSDDYSVEINTNSDEEDDKKEVEQNHGLKANVEIKREIPDFEEESAVNKVTEKVNCRKADSDKGSPILNITVKQEIENSQVSSAAGAISRILEGPSLLTQKLPCGAGIPGPIDKVKVVTETNPKKCVSEKNTLIRKLLQPDLRHHRQIVGLSSNSPLAENVKLDQSSSKPVEELVNSAKDINLSRVCEKTDTLTPASVESTHVPESEVLKLTSNGSSSKSIARAQFNIALAESVRSDKEKEAKQCENGSVSSLGPGRKLVSPAANKKPILPKIVCKPPSIKVNPALGSRISMVLMSMSSIMPLPTSALSSNVIPNSGTMLLPTSVCSSDIMPKSSMITPKSGTMLLPTSVCSADIMPKSSMIKPKSGTMLLPTSVCSSDIMPKSSMIKPKSGTMFLPTSVCSSDIMPKSSMIKPNSGTMLLPTSVCSSDIMPKSSMITPKSGTMLLPTSACSTAIMPTKSSMIMPKSSTVLLPTSACSSAIMPKSSMITPKSSTILLPTSACSSVNMPKSSTMSFATLDCSSSASLSTSCNIPKGTNLSGEVSSSGQYQNNNPSNSGEFGAQRQVHVDERVIKKLKRNHKPDTIGQQKSGETSSVETIGGKVKPTRQRAWSMGNVSLAKSDEITINPESDMDDDSEEEISLQELKQSLAAKSGNITSAKNKEQPMRPVAAVKAQELNTSGSGDDCINPPNDKNMDKELQLYMKSGVKVDKKLSYKRRLRSSGSMCSIDMAAQTPELTRLLNQKLRSYRVKPLDFRINEENVDDTSRRLAKQKHELQDSETVDTTTKKKGQVRKALEDTLCYLTYKRKKSLVQKPSEYEKLIWTSPPLKRGRPKKNAPDTSELPVPKYPISPSKFVEAIDMQPSKVPVFYLRPPGPTASTLTMPSETSSESIVSTVEPQTISSNDSGPLAKKKICEFFLYPPSNSAGSTPTVKEEESTQKDTTEQAITYNMIPNSYLEDPGTQGQGKFRKILPKPTLQAMFYK